MLVFLRLSVVFEVSSLLFHINSVTDMSMYLILGNEKRSDHRLPPIYRYESVGLRKALDTLIPSHCVSL